MQNEVIVLLNRDTKTYTKGLQTCVYSILENHVGAKHVGPVINTVLSLVNKKANKLPCVSTIINMNLQRLVLSQIQLAEILSQNLIPLFTQMRPPNLEIVCGYHVRNTDGNYFTLGPIYQSQQVIH